MIMMSTSSGSDDGGICWASDRRYSWQLPQKKWRMKMISVRVLVVRRERKGTVLPSEL